jgi:hypothetical protein
MILWFWFWVFMLFSWELCGGYGGVGIAVSCFVEGNSVEDMVELVFGCDIV